MQQLGFAFPDPSALVGATPATPARDRLLDAFETALLSRTDDRPDYLSWIFAVTAYRDAPITEPADPIATHLLGFPPDIPHAFTNLANGRIGTLFETLVADLYDFAHPEAYRTDWTHLLGQLSDRNIRRKADKVITDFHLCAIAYEMKYRTGSFETRGKQAQTVRFLRDMGLHPLMLCLRPSPNAAGYRKAGWTVLEADDCLTRVRADTGHDFAELMRDLAARPAVAAARKAGRRAMAERNAQAILGSLSHNPDLADRVEALMDREMHSRTP